MGVTTLSPQNYNLMANFVSWGIFNQPSSLLYGVDLNRLQKIDDVAFSRGMVSPRLAIDTYMLSVCAAKSPEFAHVSTYELRSSLLRIAGKNEILEHAHTLPDFELIAGELHSALAAGMFGIETGADPSEYIGLKLLANEFEPERERRSDELIEAMLATDKINRGALPLWDNVIRRNNSVDAEAPAVSEDELLTEVAQFAEGANLDLETLEKWIDID